MSIDFSTLQGLTIPEGVVTQIADASGRVIWAVANNENTIPAVLQVAKTKASTIAGGVTYTDEEFILLDIYPLSANSKVKVTYGGLTKTLQFSGTNAQKVYFGTFNGVSDSVTTPASGELTIEGGYSAFGEGSYTSQSPNKTTTGYSSCITKVIDLGSITTIPDRMFSSAKLELIDGSTIANIPDTVTSIGANAFYYVNYPSGEQFSLTLPASVTSIGDSAFYYANISEIRMLSTVPPTIAAQALGATAGLTITVPKGCADAYKSATNYDYYKNSIKEA